MRRGESEASTVEGDSDPSVDRPRTVAVGSTSMGGDADETLPAPAGGGDVSAGRTLAIGAQVAGRYRVMRRLGEGGMGEVYAVDDLILGMTVALKTLRPELEGSTIALERFRREMAFARKVTNEHVCRLHDVGEHDGRVFLTMELLEGKTLAARLAGGGVLALDEVERLAVQLVEGLGALHAAGIVHRDFKPGNVILVGERAVITDFGLARSMIDRDVALTAETGMLGTPAYMAPEQVEGRTVTPATDVYALGVVLFELVTGTLPFREDTALATATARLHGDPPKPSSVRAGVPARWDAIVARCLARDPARRPPVDAVLDTTPRRVSRRWFLAAGAGVATAGGIVGWRFLDRRGGAPASVADGSAVVASNAAAASDELVAVLPVEGTGDLVDDPLRVALTLDIHDALAECGVPKLSLEGNPMFVDLAGSAIKLAAEDDVSVAAWKIAGLSAIVRMTIAKRPDGASPTIAIAVAIERRGAPTWTGQLARPATEATGLAHDVASVVANELGRPAPRMPRDASTVAIETYTRYGAAIGGLYARDELTALEQLVVAEPTLLRAGARLALRLVSELRHSEDGARIASFTARGREVVEQILAIDPDQPLALCARGVGAMAMYDWSSADRDTTRALELAPTSWRHLQERGIYLLYQGRFDDHDVVAARKRALNPLQKPIQGTANNLLLYRQWPELVRYIPTVLEEVKPVGVRKTLQLWLALAYAELARFDEALATVEQGINPNDPYMTSIAVAVLALCGQRDRAVALRKELGERAGPGATALMDDALGNIDAALTNLEKVVDEHHLEALYLKIQRYSPMLRSQPRFQALMKRVGLS
jgi:tetratricopeptide (TPR) repeat protein